MSELNLAAARNSMWEAIDNWSETAGVFAEDYRFNEAIDQIDLNGPSISDFPAIMILPTSVTPAWFTHEMMQFPMVYGVTVWTQDWALPEGEDLIERVMNAIYRATPPGQTVTYVKKATGFYPERLGPISWKFIKTGQDQAVKATAITMNIGLRLQKDPFAN